MAKIYMRLIEKGKITINDVPESLKTAVEALLASRGAD